MGARAQAGGDPLGESNLAVWGVLDPGLPVADTGRLAVYSRLGPMATVKGEGGPYLTKETNSSPSQANRGPPPMFLQ